MSLLGKHIRDLRKQNNLTLQQLAGALDMDVGLLSKIERGQRQVTRALVYKLADYFGLDSRELMVKHLGDKILNTLDKEELAPEALKAAEEQLHYTTAATSTSDEVTEQLQSYFKNDDRIEKAWIFGSYARREQTGTSDLDVMVEFKRNMRITLFDLAEIKLALEDKTGLIIDLVEKGAVKEHAAKNVEKDLQLVYNSGEHEG